MAAPKCDRCNRRVAYRTAVLSGTYRLLVCGDCVRPTDKYTK